MCNIFQPLLASSTFTYPGSIDCQMVSPALASESAVRAERMKRAPKLKVLAGQKALGRFGFVSTRTVPEADAEMEPSQLLVAKYSIKIMLLFQF